MPAHRFALHLLPLLFICAAQSRQQSPANIYERSHSSVVVIVVFDAASHPTAQGSGFIVAKDRVVTNHHVVDQARSAMVVFADGTSQRVDGIAADSPARDLAILAVHTGIRTPLKLANELELKQGDSVYALGAPRGLELSLTNGIVSGFRDVEGQFLIQTTAAIAPGSSGGPLLDSSGRVVGVTTASLSDSPGIYFSVTATDVTRMLRTPGIVLPFTPTKVEAGTNASRETPAPSAPVSPATVDKLYLTSEPPGASIFIDGIKQTGRTPERLNLAEGTYNLVVRLYGYEPYANHIKISGEAQFDAKLTEIQQGNSSFAEIATAPSGADIYVDGHSTDQLSPARVRMSIGNHLISMRANGFRTAERQVEIKEGMVTFVTQTLLPK